jgi:hypothetical protein
MTRTKLPQFLLDLAGQLDLTVLEDRQILVSSNVGGGVELDRWLTCYDDEIYLEFVLTGDSIENPVGSTAVTEFGPIKPDAAEAMLQRWATLRKLEDEHDETYVETADRVSRELLARLTHSNRRAGRTTRTAVAARHKD